MSDAALKAEHENFLAVHRDNMALVLRNAELKESANAHRDAQIKAQAALKEAREALQEKSEWAKKMRQSYEDEIASSRQRAEKYREALIRMMSKVEIMHGKNHLGEAWDYAVAALADDKPQESLECKHRFFPYYPGNGWVQCSQCGLTKDQASPEFEKP